MVLSLLGINSFADPLLGWTKALFSQETHDRTFARNFSMSKSLEFQRTLENDYRIFRIREQTREKQ
jgi:hypothetical protein